MRIPQARGLSCCVKCYCISLSQKLSNIYFPSWPEEISAMCHNNCIQEHYQQWCPCCSSNNLQSNRINEGWRNLLAGWLCFGNYKENKINLSLCAEMVVSSKSVFQTWILFLQLLIMARVSLISFIFPQILIVNLTLSSSVGGWTELSTFRQVLATHIGKSVGAILTPFEFVPSAWLNHN